MKENNKHIFIDERRGKIVEHLNKVEKATVEDIIDNFNISKSTVRRDLIYLERRNLIIKTHGGALNKKFFKYEFTLNEKKDLNLDKKKKIAKIAKRFINDEDVIYISGGTTTLELAKILYDFKNLVVFTNAVNILLELINNEGIKIKLLGGNFRNKTLSMVGQDTIDQMQRYNFRKSFIGANGVSVEEGITTPNELEAKVDGEVVRRSKETFLLADDSKFGAVAFSVICELDEVEYIITNKEINPDLAKRFKDRNIEVITE